MGDIHKYSANSIDRVLIQKGNKRPIQIVVQMLAEVGFFQIEEVLLPKINSSPAKEYIELSACVEGAEPKCYL
jgi:metal-dependent HD superfamily phosphatase/phosphodiesterase